MVVVSMPGPLGAHFMARLGPGAGDLAAGADGAHSHPDALDAGESHQGQRTARDWRSVVFSLVPNL